MHIESYTKSFVYGCGPPVVYNIRVAAESSAIVLAEYDDTCRNAIQDWPDCSPSVCCHGNLLLYSMIRNREEGDDTPGYHHIGREGHTEVALPLEFVHATLNEYGFEANKLPEKEIYALRKNARTDLESMAFISAAKLHVE